MMAARFLLDSSSNVGERSGRELTRPSFSPMAPLWLDHLHAGDCAHSVIPAHAGIQSFCWRVQRRCNSLGENGTVPRMLHPV